MPDSSLQLVVNVEDPNQSGLLQAFLQSTPAIVPDYVRFDKTMAVTVRPVVASDTEGQDGGRPWDDDTEAGDAVYLAIGNPDESATAGTFKLTLDGNSTGMTALAYNITAAALNTLLQVVSTAEGFGVVNVTSPATGVYVATWVTTGAAVPAIVADPANLIPYCDINVSVLYDGDETPSTHPQQVISIKQQNVALSQPATPLPAAGVTRTYDQTATTGQNNIARITFDAAGTYGGLYAISAVAGGVSAACGLFGPLMTPDEIGIQMAQTHPGIFYQDATEANNISVSMDGADVLVEFLGTLSGPSQTRTVTSSSVANPSVITITGDTLVSAWKTGDTVTIAGHSGSTPSINGNHVITVINATTFSIPVNVTVGGTGGTAFNTTESTLTVADNSLLAPTGFSGVLNLNTYNLANQFWNSDDEELTFKFSITRTRSSGEVRTILIVTVTIKRNILDLTSLVPVTFPTPLTANTGVNFYEGVTAYTGGAGALDGVATVDLDVPLMAAFVHSSDGGRIYYLRAGTDAESVFDIIRPDDYATTTNEKVWESLF